MSNNQNNNDRGDRNDRRGEWASQRDEAVVSESERFGRAPRQRSHYESQVGHYGAGSYNSGSFDTGYGSGGFGGGDYSYNSGYANGTSSGFGGAGQARGAQNYGQRGTDHPMMNQRGLGHAGKGPANFQRNDERIREDICQHLSDHDDVDASQIEVAVGGGEVTLSGSVDHRGTKRLAEDIAAHVPGVKDVHNQLRIGASGATERGTSATLATGKKSSTPS